MCYKFECNAKGTVLFYVYMKLSVIRRERSETVPLKRHIFMVKAETACEPFPTKTEVIRNGEGEEVRRKIVFSSDFEKYI